MLRLTKYLKPYLLLILASVILLFIQANADLALPDYLSKIVNIGIQQGGVESTVPVAIRKSQMDHLFLFMTPDERTDVLSAYTLVDKGSPEYDASLETYPVLSTEAIYIQNALDDVQIEALDPVMARAFLVVTGIEKALDNPELMATIAPGLAFDPAMLPPGTDILDVLAQLPPAMLTPLTSTITEKLAAYDEKLIIQMAIQPVKDEYNALGMNTDKLQSDYIRNAGMAMLLITLLSGVCTVIVGYLSARTAAGFSRDVRREVFKRVESFSNAEFDKFSTASLITRTTNDVTQVQMVVIMIMRMVIYAPIIGVGGVIRALGKTTSMWWIIALAVVILLGLILTVFSIALPRFKSIQGLIDRLNLVTRENLAGMMVIRAFNMQGFEENRFDNANKDLTRVSLFINRVMVIMMPAMMLIMNGLSLLIIWVGAHEVAASNMQVGDMMAFMQYAMQIMFAFLTLAMLFIFLPRAAVSGERIADVLETIPTINDPVEPLHFPTSFTGKVEFRKVAFRYPGAEEDVIHDISFTANAGETTAFIGTTGSGKSTIISLIPRFYDVTSGAILLDGIDIRQVTQHELRTKIGYIPQKSNLFSGTIESNLRYADENATDEELKLAADIAQASEFINEKPEGLHAEIAQGGLNVSGGQKQRLSIARALVKKAPIYIFDDSFSALDFKTDSALRKALKEHTSRSTLFIVTQRIATIKNAEQIIVLDEGRISGKGTHTELMKKCDVYRDIALSQLSKEELQ